MITFKIVSAFSLTYLFERVTQREGATVKSFIARFIFWMVTVVRAELYQSQEPDSLRSLT